MNIPSTKSFGPDQWVREPELLESNHGHTYIAITKRNTVESFRVKVNDEQLLSLIRSEVSDGASWNLKLVVTEKTWVSRDIRRLPFPVDVLEGLMQHWKISEVCFSAHARAGSCSLPFHPVPGDPSYSGIVIRLVYGLPFRGTLAIAHDRNTNTTYAVCFGIAPEHSRLLLTRLEASQDYAFFPLHVAYLLTDIALTNLEHFSSNTYSDFLSVREAMGTNLYFLPAQVSQTPNLSELPRKLTALANAAASNCSSLRGVGIIVDMLSTHLHNRHEDIVTCDNATACVYTDRLTLMKQVVESTLRRNEYLKESVQAQVQMVYALVAQKDNELNHQYGADMRLISIVTLVFLPGTFVATLFSTSFWDFSPSNDGAMVSKWVWLYIVVTALLTTGVVGFWMRWPLFGEFWGRRRSSAPVVELQVLDSFLKLSTLRSTTRRVHDGYN